MTLSMTGFGRHQSTDGDCTQVWEVRSVNGRNLDFKWRLPMPARSLETRLEKLVRGHATRGKVEITLNLQCGSTASVRFDEKQAANLLTAVQDFARSRGDAWLPDYGMLLHMSSLWISNEGEDEEKAEIFAKALEAGLEQALQDWNSSRLAEGKNLESDLRTRFKRIAEWVEQMEEASPRIKEERLLQVRKRLQEMLASMGGFLDDSRFLQEIVILADKLDVSEELTRMRSHLQRLEELLSSEDAGRKLDFTLQECFREINTCGNKIQDAQISRLVVDFKNELEKCREQVQNLE